MFNIHFLFHFKTFLIFITNIFFWATIVLNSQTLKIFLLLSVGF